MHKHDKNTPQQNLDSLDSISKRLKYLVDTLGVKQSHMAEKLGVSPSGLHYILNNDVKFSKNAKKIAEYLNINEHWLTTGEGEIYQENTSIKTYKIPIYYPDQLKIYFHSKKNMRIKTNDYLITTTHYKNRIIAIYLTESYFTQKFEPGDVIAFEEADDFDDGDIVLTYLNDTSCICINYAFHQGHNETILISPGCTPKKTHTNNCIIIGIYRECVKKNPSKYN